jgi:hypothetical protein
MASYYAVASAYGTFDESGSGLSEGIITLLDEIPFSGSTDAVSSVVVGDLMGADWPSTNGMNYGDTRDTGYDIAGKTVLLTWEPSVDVNQKAWVSSTAWAGSYGYTWEQAKDWVRLSSAKIIDAEPIKFMSGLCGEFTYTISATARKAKLSSYNQNSNISYKVTWYASIVSNAGWEVAYHDAALFPSTNILYAIGIEDVSRTNKIATMTNYIGNIDYPSPGVQEPGPWTNDSYYTVSGYQVLDEEALIRYWPVDGGFEYP